MLRQRCRQELNEIAPTIRRDVKVGRGTARLSRNCIGQLPVTEKVIWESRAIARLEGT